MKKLLLGLAAALPLVLIAGIAVSGLSWSDTRRVGAITATDKPLPLSWRGGWSAEATYVPGQAVSYRGASYVAEVENGNSAPDPQCTRQCSWGLMAASAGEKGDPGPQGDPGAKGETGAKGDHGAAGPSTDTITGSIVVPACPTQQNGWNVDACNFLGAPQGHTTGWGGQGGYGDFSITLQSHPVAITTPAVATNAALLAANTPVAPGSGNGFDRRLTLYIMVVPNGPVLPCQISGTATSCTGTAPPDMTIPPGSRVVATVSASSGYPGGRIDFGWRLG